MKWVQCGPGDFAGDPPSLRRCDGSPLTRTCDYFLTFSRFCNYEVGAAIAAFSLVSGLAVIGLDLADFEDAWVEYGAELQLVVLKCTDPNQTIQCTALVAGEKKLWFQPECTGIAAGEEGLIGPSPRAFHVAVAIDCNMFIFGGRYGRKRFGDFWMLDTETWQWVELTGYGDLPPPRDFAAGASVGNGKLVIYGGWDGTKWLSDVYVLDTMSLEWVLLPLPTGPAPAPRCGHTATMVEKRMLIFGGRGGGGPIMGDLWALKGLFDEEQEPPAWTQLKLPGTGPAPRCGHSTTAGGSQLLVFGGHGTGGWLTRYDIYHNDCVVLDRATVQWKRLAVSNEPPPARAYHTMTRIGPRFLLIGGYDGKSTFADMWWLVNEEDEIAKRAVLSPASSFKTAVPDTSKTPLGRSPLTDSKTQGESTTSPLNELRQRLGLPAVAAVPVPEIGGDDEELLALGRELLTERDLNSPATATAVLKAIREHWSRSDAHSVQIRELSPLLRDYRRLVATHQRGGILKSGLSMDGEGTTLQVYRFYHLKDANQVRMDDVPALLTEYKQLLHRHHTSDVEAS